MSGVDEGLGAWERRTVRTVGAVAVVAALAVWMFCFVLFPRDESGFLRYVHTFPGTYEIPEGADEHAIIAAANDQAARVSDATLVAAGDRACSTLRWRAPGGVRLGDAAVGDHPYDRYHREAERQVSGWSGYPQSDSVVAGAFAYLCPGSVALHRTYHPWGHPD